MPGHARGSTVDQPEPLHEVEAHPQSLAAELAVRAARVQWRAARVVRNQEERSPTRRLTPELEPKAKAEAAGPGRPKPAVARPRQTGPPVGLAARMGGLRPALPPAARAGAVPSRQGEEAALVSAPSLASVLAEAEALPACV